MLRRPPGSTRADPLFPSTPRCRRANRTLRACGLGAAVAAAALADAVEVAETAFEERLQATRVAATALRAGIELGKVRTGPEALLESVGLVLGAVEQAALAEDDHPRRDRGDQQQQHHELHRDRGMQQQDRK